MLTKKQKELLIDLIDGYFYPRDLIEDYEKFLEIRKVLDPNDLWIDNFQHGYYVHPDLKNEVSIWITQTKLNLIIG